MTAAEQGLLLLCCPLEDGMTPLTAAQYRRLRELVRNRRKEEDGNRELTAEDLAAIGCGMQESAQIRICSGCMRTTSSVCVPIEPVDPRMLTAFIMVSPPMVK